MIAQLRFELGLVWSFLRSGGGSRAAVIALCTALVSGLLMVAVTVVMVTWVPAREHEQLSNLVSQGGLRGGYVFALLLICIAPLALLQQVVRLGTASREQRLAALRLAGATTGDVRRLGAIEVGLPALAGGFLGLVVFGLLRVVFGGTPLSGPRTTYVESAVAQQFQLVPTTIHPPWWGLLLIALGVGLLGVCAGAMTSRSLLISPLGVSRRAPRSAPRPWALLLIVVAVALFILAVYKLNSVDYLSPGAEGRRTIADLCLFGALGTFLLGVIALAPWVAYRIGRVVAARASTVPVLLAGRRLATDPRPAGRAAAAVGAIAVVAGGTGATLGGVVSRSNYGGGAEVVGRVDPFFAVSLLLVGLMLLAALLLVVFSLAVHGVESLSDHRRSVASLAVLGVSRHELEAAQRWEVGLVAIPMAVIGVCIGSAPMLSFSADNPLTTWIPLLVDGATVLLVWVAVRASARMTRPWLVRAAAPASLRTP